MTLNKSRLVASAIFGAVTMLIGGVGGYFLNDYFNFASERRAELRREYNEAQTAAAKVLADLQAFSDQATGERVVSASEKITFRKNVTVLHQDAKDVAARVLEVESVFKEYANAMVELQNAALSMTGPADAKVFVESLSYFLETQENFDKQVRESQEDYLGSLF